MTMNGNVVTKSTPMRAASAGSAGSATTPVTTPPRIQRESTPHPNSAPRTVPRPRRKAVNDDPVLTRGDSNDSSITATSALSDTSFLDIAANVVANAPAKRQRRGAAAQSRAP
jgi:hypothetical protein